MKYTSISPDLFVENRQRYKNRLKSNSVAIFHSNDQMPLNGDAVYPFRQNSDFFYLTGIDQEKSILILAPDCPNHDYREVLFVVETNEHLATWEGHKYSKAEATQASGIRKVVWVESFESILSYVLNHAENVYLNLNENDRSGWMVPYKDLRFANELKAKFPLHNYHRSGPIMAELRAIKSSIEVDLLRKAIDITDKAFQRVMKFVKPGVMEYEVEAEIIHEFIRNRATGHAYEPIIASGGSACVLHYIENNKPCLDGDVILMDFGANYANYNADLTRCIPVNGKFTKRQKEVYNSVLKVHRQIKDLMVPGKALDDLRKAAGLMIQDELLSLGLITTNDVKNASPERPAFFKYYPHGIGHFLGLDVHDIGDRFAPIQPGMVFTCEPGIYIKEENLGIRIENNILVTLGKPVDLMEQIPIEADHIEDFMASAR
ncbi:MAG: aminopeptidase P family protein [Bacteroidia bacterium]|nr:aminopeptidase P family protein [Bacteroidia bacterium]